MSSKSLNSARSTRVRRLCPNHMIWTEDWPRSESLCRDTRLFESSWMDTRDGDSCRKTSPSTASRLPCSVNMETYSEMQILIWVFTAMCTATLVTSKCAELFTRVQDSLLEEIRYAHADSNLNTSFRGCFVIYCPSYTALWSKFKLYNN